MRLCNAELQLDLHKQLWIYGPGRNLAFHIIKQQLQQYGLQIETVQFPILNYDELKIFQLRGHAIEDDVNEFLKHSDGRGFVCVEEKDDFPFPIHLIDDHSCRFDKKNLNAVRDNVLVFHFQEKVTITKEIIEIISKMIQL